FGYACHRLGISLKTSSVPQAKGRVESVFGTLQSRLITELKINCITTIEEANKFLNGYIKRFNEQFGFEINIPCRFSKRGQILKKLTFIWQF
ncbi:MAG: hypothetical protein LBF82_01930, partial [Lactobacillales bacterium]|nr:hypothetical protein [Lactobacillales bacterium]